jgi:hypothetical protein
MGMVCLSHFPGFVPETPGAASCSTPVDIGNLGNLVKDFYFIFKLFDF